MGKAPPRRVKHVVEEPVLLVPQLDALVAHAAHGLGDIHEVLEELGGHVLVGGILAGQLERDAQHVEAVHAHPRRAIRLRDVATRRERGRAVEDPDVIETEEAALEDVLAFRVLAVDPPGEVQ
jgi:hypothetical protein